MKLLTYSILLVFLSCSTTAAGQQCPESRNLSADRAQARKMYQQGVGYYKMKRYELALENFNCSYRLHPHKDTLFNLGRCNEKLENYTTATENYRLYMEKYPEASDISDIKARIHYMEYRIEQRATETEGQLAQEETSETVNHEAEQLEQIVMNEQGYVATLPMRQMSVARKSAWTTLALGLLLSGSGTGLFGKSLSILGDVEERKLNQYCDTSLKQMSYRGEVYMYTGIALMGVGVATLITSILLFTAFDGTQFSSQADASILHLGAMATGQGGGLVLNGRF